MNPICGDRFANSAIRCCFVNTLIEFPGIRRMSQQRVHVPDASLPSPGSARASSPASSVLSRHCDFLPPLPPHFVSFAWRYHGSTPLFAPAAAACGRRRAWGWSPGIPVRELLPWRRQDLPSSWGTPIPVCSCSPTPAGRCVPDHCGTLAWPPLRERRRRRRQQTFEAQ